MKKQIEATRYLIRVRVLRILLIALPVVPPAPDMFISPFL